MEVLSRLQNLLTLSSRQVTDDVDGHPSGRKKTKAPDNGTLKPNSPPSYPEFVVDPSHCYDVSTKPRGYFLLINNKDFLPISKMDKFPRRGTDLDADAMKALFKELGFIVESYKNLRVHEMREKFFKVARMDYSGFSIFACCVLSHGREGGLYGTDGTIDITELISFFCCKNLAGKPKLFFFQASRGSNYMDAVEPNSVGLDVVDGPLVINDISLPMEADFLYAYSTVPGYVSWRNADEGSWFIQAIVKVFRQYAHKMELVRMLTRVNNIVATKKSQTKQGATSNNKCQIPSIITQLRKALYFVPPNGPLESYAGDF